MPKRTITVDTMYYIFHQNNSHGRTDRDDAVGDIVVIEAPSAKEANSIAEDIGIYFDGCEKELDCSCCGDRWHPAHKESNSSDEYDVSKTFDITKFTDKDSSIYEEYILHLYEYKSTHTMYTLKLKNKSKSLTKRGYEVVEQKEIK